MYSYGTCVCVVTIRRILLSLDTAQGVPSGVEIHGINIVSRSFHPFVFPVATAVLVGAQKRSIRMRSPQSMERRGQEVCTNVEMLRVEEGTTLAGDSSEEEDRKHKVWVCENVSFVS